MYANTHIHTHTHTHTAIRVGGRDKIIVDKKEEEKRMKV